LVFVIQREIGVDISTFADLNARGLKQQASKTGVRVEGGQPANYLSRQARCTFCNIRIRQFIVPEDELVEDRGPGSKNISKHETLYAGAEH
jgi:hypothetical protein